MIIYLTEPEFGIQIVVLSFFFYAKPEEKSDSFKENQLLFYLQLSLN